MTFGWREHPDARDEYRAAAEWYESRRAGWGDVFMDSVDSAVYSVRDSSVSWGFYLDREQTPQVYARNVAGFPFNIIYLLTDRDVVVLAYAHEKRRPGYWTTRLTG